MSVIELRASSGMHIKEDERLVMGFIEESLLLGNNEMEYDIGGDLYLC